MFLSQVAYVRGLQTSSESLLPETQLDHHFYHFDAVVDIDIGPLREEI